MVQRVKRRERKARQRAEESPDIKAARLLARQYRRDKLLEELRMLLEMASENSK